MSKFVKKEPPCPETIDLGRCDGQQDSPCQEISVNTDQLHLDHETGAALRAGLCLHAKSDGSPCGAFAQKQSRYCFFHDPHATQERDAARILGGKERSRKAAVLPPDTPDTPLTTAADVTKLLVETINQVRRGELDPRVSNTVGFLTGYLLKAQQQEQVERRLERVESILTQKWVNPNFALAQQPETGSFEFVKAKPRGEA